MVGLFRAVVERVKAVLAVRAAQEIEADALSHARFRRLESWFEPGGGPT
jgi:hypothetical protein